MISSESLKSAQNSLKKVDSTRVRLSNGDTYEVDIHDPAFEIKNKSKGEPPEYLDRTKSISYPQIPRFDMSDEKERVEGLRYLEENGYVVCASVLSESELECARNKFWDFIEGIPGRLDSPKKHEKWPKRGKPETWENFPGNPTYGIIASMGAGQSPFAWFVRSRPRVKDAFAAVWSTNDLLVSFDGFGAFRPWKYKSSWRTRGGWFHVDQNAKYKPGKCCIQGLVSMFDQDHTTGGLTVISGSHHMFEDYASRNPPRHSMDFVRIQSEDIILKKKPILVSCKAGDLCLWDSRLVHCNSPAPKTNSLEPKSRRYEDKFFCADAKQDQDLSHLLRLVCYVCMTPTSKASSQVLPCRFSLGLCIHHHKMNEHIKTISSDFSSH
mmetsp:Transcript_1327/g.2226  ORF Transcript_1327/g.2226 Transcript_1327/m.2226 type:complete len:381 (-) Transcript_1327:330-1472(-)